MNSRIISLRIRPGKMDQALRIFRSSILPATKNQRGNASVLVFCCREKNELISCTLWETYEDMMETERSGILDQQIAKLSTVLAESPQGDEYELEILS